MRKFFLGLILIIIAGGFAFFFGWAQLKVPPGSYGVMRSKTHGIDPTLIREGEFRWVWYKLIPTNVTITVFSPAFIDRAVHFTGTLPSADSYRAFLGLKADFSYEFSGSLSFSIKPGSLPALVRERGIGNQDDLAEFEEALASDLTGFATRRLQTYIEEDASRLTAEDINRLLREDIGQAYPSIENVACAVRVTRFPDFALYQSARSLYEDYLSRQRELLAGEIHESAGRRLDSQLRFDELAQYGELLTKYPVLLQYLALEKGER
ncbi:MAG: hypothetical protein LBG76_01815 [Treponema sp.]|jgi:hypothetical protein|nr:hypothetical protein [Treponema sp.]